MKSKKMIWFKRVMALVIAGLLLNGFCYFYYNPTAYVLEESRSTDVIREPNAFTARGKEGFAYATMDANGYNNAFVPKEGEIFALMMGASHTEGMNVLQEETTSAQLSALFEKNNIKGYAYNIGISSHYLDKNAANLRYALERFRPTGYVVLETSSLEFGTKTIEDAINDCVPQISETRIPLKAITGQPIFKTLYKQFKELTMKTSTSTSSAAAYRDYGQYKILLTQLFSQMKSVADEYGVQLIIYYHPHLRLLEDGSAVGISEGKYFTPNGVSLAEVGGLIPDITVDVTDEESFGIYAGTLDPMEDPQIQAALNRILEK